MKNKKLIATVASLCLVLVAVVAAVIGVLAAATQNVSNKVKVTYIANNVNADVSIAGRLERDASFSNTITETESLKKSWHFAPQEGTTTKALGTNDLSLAWSGNTLDRYVVYQFKFENKSETKGLEVKLTYTKVAEDNVELRWYQSTAASLTPTIAYESDGSLMTTTDTSSQGLFSVTSGTKTDAILNIAKVSSDAQVAYIYLVVAVDDINSDAHFGLGGAEQTDTWMNNTLVFELNSVVSA
jgi:hypothetical protein